MPTYKKCGHVGETPAHMGRGASRLRRIEQHFAGNCLSCKRENYFRLARQLCVLLPGYNAAGKRNSRKYTEEEVQAYVEKWMGV